MAVSFPNIQSSLRDMPHTFGDYLASLPDDHPLQIALRTYALALSFALGPALLSSLTSPKARTQRLKRVVHLLKRELGVTGFAFAMTVGVAGGAAIRRAWDMLDEIEEDKKAISSRTSSSFKSWLASIKDSRKTFVSSIVSSSLAITLLHTGRQTVALRGKPPPTLDLTLLLLVRAMDSLVQITFFKPSISVEEQLPEETRAQRKKLRHSWSARLDALVFWACSARIMWCFFYKPERLPRSYNKWIMTMANIDPRLLTALRALRSDAFSYRKGLSSPPDLVSSLASDLGYPPSWGEASLLPAFGGKQADAAWKVLQISNRRGIGGMPCEIVHGGMGGGSCAANAGIRGAQVFAEAVALYLPVHVLPILLTRPRTLLHIPRLASTLLSVIRSASFLSAFVASIWYAVCLTRTLLLARLFPQVSHDFWDGPFGCTFVGSLVCGASIWIEQGHRRGEMALYVLPRAIRACLPDKWIMSGRRSVRIVERVMFVLSLSTLVTAAMHRQDSLRGLSRWTLAFVTKGPNAGFWKRRRQDTNTPPTPRETSPPAELDSPPPGTT